MKYVKEIRSNLKCGVATKLGPLTLLVGPPGSGKTAVLNSIELALTGAVSDAAVGHDLLKRPIDLMPLAKDGADTLGSEAVLSDDTVCSWVASTTRGERAAKHNLQGAVISESVFPLRVLREQLFGVSLENARKYLLSQIADFDRAQVEALIPTPLRENFGRVFPQRLSPADALLAAAEGAAAKVREANATVKVRQAEAQAVTPISAPNAAQVATAEADVRAARTVLEQSAAAEAVGRAMAHYEARRAAATATLASVEPELARVKAALEAIPPDPELAPVIDAACKLQRWHAVSGEPNCSVCGAEVGTTGHFERRAVAASQYLADSQMRAQERYRLQGLQRDLLGKMAAAKYALAETVPTAAPTVVPLENARFELTAAEHRLQTLRTAVQAWERTNAARDAAAEAESEAAVWKQVKTAIDAAILTLLDQAVAKFQAAVQRYLPEPDRFVVKLRDDERPVFFWGLQRGETLHIGLSGFESARVCLAMALALSEKSNSQLRIFVPEDRGTDPEALASLMVALARAAGSFQVILLSTVHPRALDATDWTIIDTGAGEHQALGVPAMPEKPKKAKRKPIFEKTCVGIGGPQDADLLRRLLGD